MIKKEIQVDITRTTMDTVVVLWCYLRSPGSFLHLLNRQHLELSVHYPLTVLKDLSQEKAHHHIASNSCLIVTARYIATRTLGES